MKPFACQDCTAAPEPLVDSNLVVVRHAPSCEVLITQNHGPLSCQNLHHLPDTPAQIPFRRV